MKQCDLKTAEWNKFYGSFLQEMKNTFIDELRKYERKALEVKMTRACEGKGLTQLKGKLAAYRPLLSDDIIVAFESLL